jgi:hypothetical protein
MRNALVPMLGILVAGAGGLTIVAGWDAASPLRRKANLLAYLVIGAGVALFVRGIILL